MALNKLGNHHLDRFTAECAAHNAAGLFDAIPKAVWAALALSGPIEHGGIWNDDEGRDIPLPVWAVREWSCLHAAGIVPQAVPARYRHLDTTGAPAL